MVFFFFGIGNVVKFFWILLYVVGCIGIFFFLCGCCWVFGCGVGIGDGVFVLYCYVFVMGYDMLWFMVIVCEECDVVVLGIFVVLKNSVCGWWVMVCVGVLVVMYGFGDVNWYVNGGVFVV